MKKKWSNKWVNSKQPRKQRKYRYNAPLHVRHKFVSSHLSENLRKRYGRRSLPVRTGDEVEVLRGSLKGFRGKIESVDLGKKKVFMEGIKVKKVDGTEVGKPLEPSNLKIIALNLDDKMRQKVLMRKKGILKPSIEEKNIPKEEKSKHSSEKEIKFVNKEKSKNIEKKEEKTPKENKKEVAK